MWQTFKSINVNHIFGQFFFLAISLLESDCQHFIHFHDNGARILTVYSSKTVSGKHWTFSKSCTKMKLYPVIWVSTHLFIFINSFANQLNHNHNKFGRFVLLTKHHHYYYCYCHHAFHCPHSTLVHFKPILFIINFNSALDI